MQMIIRTVTQQCPVCGYIFKKQSKVETRTIPPSRLITCKPGYGPVIHDKSTEKECVVGTEILAGDKPFIKVTETEIKACGSPWCGKERLNTKCVIPLNGIFLSDAGGKNQQRKERRQEPPRPPTNHSTPL